MGIIKTLNSRKTVWQSFKHKLSVTHVRVPVNTVNTIAAEVQLKKGVAI